MEMWELNYDKPTRLILDEFDKQLVRLDEEIELRRNRLKELARRAVAPDAGKPRGSEQTWRPHEPSKAPVTLRGKVVLAEVEVEDCPCSNRQLAR